MVKNNFLLVDLSESKTKKVAETITSDTSRKILNHLAEKEDSENNIAKSLGIAISTVHYHLQKLQEAGLVIVEEFHYSKKGREINHYKLANKYIIIAPKKVSGLKQKLRGILPVSAVFLGISAVIKIVQEMSSTTDQIMMESIPMAADIAQEEVVAASAREVASSAPMMADAGMQTTTAAIQSSPDIALWFLLGGVSVIVLYVLYSWVKEKLIPS